ncbi:restriction endonuclease subunit S [Photobacterium leiognathi]|uniref:restriction endonuclease subunit S n=1 Tax=Photobacterium leiognathi TaxID=553611 RepID=UPI002981891B|nr:restriction endonuclease subunit S [Photobacterium leiognathi]
MTFWKTESLSSLGLVQTGSTPKTSIKENFGDAIPFIKPADFKLDGTICYGNDGLSSVGLASSRLVPRDSVLMVCIGATIGKVGYTSIDVTTNQQINSLTPSDKISAKYCYYFMLQHSFKQQVVSNAGQATLPIINKTKWSRLEISYPENIDAQQKIVTKIDKAFSDIEKAKQNAEQNLKNARELFDSYLQNVFRQKGDDWIDAKLGDLAEFKNGLNFSKSSKGELINVVGVKDFSGNFSVPYTQLDVIRIDGSLDKAYELKCGDILTVRSNGNKRLIGRCLLVEESEEKISYSGFTIRIRLNGSDVVPKFLMWHLKSPDTHELLIGAGGGANISNLNQKILSSLPLSFPDRPSQEKIVSVIESIRKETMRLESIYKRKVEVLDELKQSILQKAFSGEL